MPTRAASAPLTPAQAVAAGRKLLEARRKAEARARRPKWVAPVVVETTVVRISALAPDRWPRCWTPPRVAVLCEVMALAVANPPPSAGEGVEPLKREVDSVAKTEAPGAAATGSKKPADLSAGPRPGSDARRKAAFAGGQGRAQRPVTLAQGRGAQDADASLRAIRAGAAKRAPKVRMAGGEGDMGKPISEQDQGFGVVTRPTSDTLCESFRPESQLCESPSAAASNTKIGEKYSDFIPEALVEPPMLIPAPTIEAAEINVTAAAVEERVFQQNPTSSAESEQTFGGYRLADLGPSQCRFACTPDHARPEDHRFCGRPTRVGRGNLHGSWCPEHLRLVWGTGSASERNAHNTLRRFG